ncbi:MAG: protein phosphatase CheZ [Desulfarculus sp.]|nr:protein phosphatase CheZ [Desulfarculus sp.]
MAAKPPEITLELSGGSLTIKTAEAIYRIVVTSSAGAPAIPAPAVAPALPAQPAPQALPGAEDDWGEPETAAPPAAAGEADEHDAEYYRDLSHDMYREVGRLARRLSMSIRDVKIEKVEDFDLSSAGQRLEQAKDQLEHVVKMTEQATLRIMDLGEEIQNAIDKARGIMDRMVVKPAEDGPAAGDDLDTARQELTHTLAALQEYLASLGEAPLEPLAQRAQALLDELGQAPPPAEEEEEPAPAPAPAPAGPRFLFPLEVVFQTIYELCTNETVKKHLKAMWDGSAQAFDQVKVEEALNDLAPEEPDQDNFLNLDLKGVLKALYQATGQDRFQQVLKKMGSTADQIFLEQTLPLEAMPAPAAAAPAAATPAPAKPKATAPAGPSPQLLTSLQELVDDLRATSARLAPPPLPPDLDELWQKVEQTLLAHSNCNVVEPRVLKELEETMGIIFSSASNIIEALSFQDLSGQAIYRIVRLLTDFQVQLLAMVVSFGSKLKVKETKAAVTTDESERMAQEEVDKVLSSLGVSEAETAGQDGAKLNQDSVNSMLQSMGF